jgi:hypothetical protein
LRLHDVITTARHVAPLGFGRTPAGCLAADRGASRIPVSACAGRAAWLFALDAMAIIDAALPHHGPALWSATRRLATW